MVAVEEPLEIRINGAPVAVTMRTPGHDEELALGFCLSEGLRPEAARLPDDLAANTVEVDAPGFDPARLQRSFYTSSSCGVCGKGALEAVAVEAPRVESELTRLGRRSSRRCRTACARRSRRSPRPAGCMRPASSPPRASSSACARTSAATTRSTRSSAGRSARAAAARRRDPLRQRPALVRARPEGGGRRLPADGRRRRAVVPRRRARRRSRDHALRLRPRRTVNVYTEPWRIER